MRELLNSGAHSVELYSQTNNIEDLQRGLSTLIRATFHISWGHEHFLVGASNLCIAVSHHQNSDAISGLQVEDIIKVLDSALATQPGASESHHSTFTQGLITVLLKRFNQTDNDTDLRAIAELQSMDLFFSSKHCLPLSDLRNLVETLTLIFDRTGEMKSRDTVIGMLYKMLELQGSLHPQQSQTLIRMGRLLILRFRDSGALDDLNTAITHYRECLIQRPNPDSSRAHALKSLALALNLRFEISGHEEDLDDAIELNREAVFLVPSPHPDRGDYLDNLGNKLVGRFTKKGNIIDLNHAIKLYEEACDLLPVSQAISYRPRLNLASALAMRFRLRSEHNIQDLNTAIRLWNEALALSPTPYDRPLILHNLAAGLKERSWETKSVEDLDTSISLYEDVVRLTQAPGLTFRHASALHNLAVVHGVRFRHTNNSGNLESALKILEDALAWVPASSPTRGYLLLNKAKYLILKYKSCGESRYIVEAVSRYREGATADYVPLQRRFDICQDWAEDAAELNHESAEEAYQHVTELLPQLATLGLDVESRRGALASVNPGLASNAAAVAISRNQLVKAIEFLESGRSIFWSQALRLRTPLDDLKHFAPEMGQKLSEIIRQLEHGSHRDLSRRESLLPDSLEQTSFDNDAKYYQRLNSEWVQVVDEVRQFPRFEGFLRQQPLSELRMAAAGGPVIILNASKTSCCALLLVTYLRAPPRSTIDELFAQLSLSYDSGRCSALETRLFWQREGGDIDHLAVVLAELWRSVVSPILRALEFKKSSNPPRLWWCPTGPFNFLPIHAAGLYDKDTTECVSEYVVSSYTPTISALIHRRVENSVPFKMTAIIQPESTGSSSLPATRDELRKIEERVPAEWLTCLGDTTGATIETALFHLRDSSVVHFACHGIQDFSNPLNSGLLLDDGRLRVSQLMQKSEEVGSYSRINGMSLAFLSACETAKGDEKQPDEAMHLAATLLFAGFRGVVATMWTIVDHDGPKVADTFYEHLFRDCDPSCDPPVTPDLTQAANALHLALGKLRQEPNIPLSRWVPFVHYGL
ncbi:CHAT domain-containing protein [Mycena leptocephala]|nr:CHAT domain-containing protein [Mycena leptocephala]